MKVLIFDVDGVLGNFDDLHKDRDVAHIKAVAEKNSISFEQARKLFFDTKEKLKKLNKFSTIDTIQSLGITKEVFYQIMNSVPVEGRITITKNAKLVLEKLSRKHVIVALTNTPSDATLKTLQHLGLVAYFDKIYSIDKYNYVKPSMDIFRKIMNDFRATEGFSIGDSIEKDLIPAKKVGLKTILFCRQKTKTTYFVDYIITDLIELTKIII